jgi:hypothetical protein
MTHICVNITKSEYKYMLDAQLSQNGPLACTRKNHLQRDSDKNKIRSRRPSTVQILLLYLCKLKVTSQSQSTEVVTSATL